MVIAKTGLRASISLLLLASSLGSAAVENAEQLLLKAQQYLEKQDWQQAESAATKALGLNPRLADAEVVLGLIETARGRPPEAEKHFRKAAALQPQNYRTLGYLASTYLQQKRLGEAAAAYQKVLKLNPGDQTAHYNLGLIGLLREKPAEALQHFEVSHSADPADVPAFIGLLETQLLLHRRPEARQSAQKLAGLVDARDPRFFQIATMLALHGEYASAIPMMERVRQSFPESYDVNYNLALAYFHAANYDKAAETVAPLLNQTRRAEAYDLLGSIEDKRGRLRESTLAFRQATEAEPGNEDYRFDFANAVLQHQTADLAVPAFAEGVSAFPKSWRIRLGLGSAYYLSGKYEQAAQVLLEASGLEPRKTLTYFLLGKTYESAPAYQDRIVERFQKYLDTNPKDSWAYCHYGSMLYLRAQSERQTAFAAARESLNQALRLNPRLAEAHLQLGIIEQAEGKYKESAGSLERAVRSSPNLAAAHYRLALSYRRLGSPDKADAEMEIFRRVKSQDQAAQERQEVLQVLAGRE